MLAPVEQETYANTILEKRRLIDAKAEAIHMILNGIGNDMYSTVDAFSNAWEMWLAIECLQQGESINKEDFLQQLQPKWSKFVTIAKQQQELDIVSYHRLFDILKEHQSEVNEIRAKNIARNAKPLALVAATQYYPDKYSPYPYYQAPKPHKTHTSSSRHTTATSSYATPRKKNKEIAKPITTPSKSLSEEDSDPEQAYQQQPQNFIKHKEQDSNQLVKDYVYHKEKMMLCKQEEKGVPLSVEHGDWLADTDDGPDEHKLEAHYIDSNVIPDSLDMCDNEGTANQNAENPEDEHLLLASLIANFKLDLSENKKSQRQLKKANTSITQELNKSKQDLEKTKQDLEKRKQGLEKTKQNLEISK
ncbi:hypothetical protein Tco_0695737 [Tanacetum coccineum]